MLPHSFVRYCASILTEFFAPPKRQLPAEVRGHSRTLRRPPASTLSLHAPVRVLPLVPGLQRKRSFECALKRFNPRHETGETPDNIRLWIARSGQVRERDNVAPAGLRTVYRRARHRRSEDGKGAVGRVGISRTVRFDYRWSFALRSPSRNRRCLAAGAVATQDRIPSGADCAMDYQASDLDH